MSRFDEYRHKKLPAWGRWSRACAPPLDASINPMYQYIPQDQGVAHGSIEELRRMVETGMVPLTHIAGHRPGMESEDEPAPDEREMEALDRQLTVLMWSDCAIQKRHFMVIKRFYYNLFKVDREDLDKAVRGLLDQIDPFRRAA